MKDISYEASLQLQENINNQYTLSSSQYNLKRDHAEEEGPPYNYL